MSKEMKMTAADSYTESRSRRLARQRKKKRRRTAGVILAVLLSAANIGFGAVNLYTLMNRNTTDVPVQETQPSETEAETSSEISPETPSETETQTEPVTETEPETSSSEEISGTSSGAGDISSAPDSLESDPRYSVTEKYDPIGIIKNVNNFLNIRVAPDPDSVSIGKAMLHTAVTVLEDEGNGWLKIRSGENEGYVSSEYVASGEEGTVLAMESCRNNAFSLTPDLPVYPSANKDGEPVFRLNPENGYTVLDIIGGWVKIQISDDLTGYVDRQEVNIRYTLSEPIFFVNNDDFSKLRLAVVNKAFEYYGGKYVWGGTRLGEGVDCSGFTLRIYESFGINLPRLSGEQAKWGTRVASMDEALPGDLLFFHGYRNGTVTEGVGHVAIYIGNGKMIHAASEARGIVADNYNYLGEPIGIRRVITKDKEAAYLEKH